MPDPLLQLDRHLFYFINHDLTNPFFNWLMPILRNPASWIPLYIFVIVFCLWKYQKTGIFIILGIVLAFGLADQTSAGFIKPIVKRLRPCNDPVVSQTDILRVPRGTGYSFPSTHATDHFAMGFFMVFLFYKRWKWILLWATLWAGSISFAQVYVGVHFPIDVFCGALYGILIGWLISLIFKKLQPQF
ncbi:MAG: phosphatase PAP2 family protein [Mucilaginibacter sp.]